VTTNRNLYEQWLDFDSSELKVRIVAFSSFDKIELVGPNFTIKLMCNTGGEEEPARGEAIFELLHTLSKAASDVDDAYVDRESTDEEITQPEAEGV
jgi:hypothetical protein